MSDNKIVIVDNNRYATWSKHFQDVVDEWGYSADANERVELFFEAETAIKFIQENNVIAVMSDYRHNGPMYYGLFKNAHSRRPRVRKVLYTALLIPHDFNDHDRYDVKPLNSFDHRKPEDPRLIVQKSTDIDVFGELLKYLFSGNLPESDSWKKNQHGVFIHSPTLEEL